MYINDAAQFVPFGHGMVASGGVLKQTAVPTILKGTIHDQNLNNISCASIFNLHWWSLSGSLGKNPSEISPMDTWLKQN